MKNFNKYVTKHKDIKQIGRRIKEIESSKKKSPEYIIYQENKICYVILLEGTRYMIDHFSLKFKLCKTDISKRLHIVNLLEKSIEKDEKKKINTAISVPWLNLA
jgi:hypothetical protein